MREWIKRMLLGKSSDELHKKRLIELKEEKIAIINEIAEARNQLSEERGVFLNEMAATLETEAKILREFRSEEFLDRVKHLKSLVTIKNSNVEQVTQNPRSD